MKELSGRPIGNMQYLIRGKYEKPEWPQAVRIALALYSMLFAALLCFFLINIPDLVSDISGIILMAIALPVCLGAFLYFARLSGIRYLGLSWRIRSTGESGADAGIRVPTGSEARLFVAFALLYSIYVFSGAYAIYSGQGDLLLPYGRDTIVTANFFMAGGLVLVIVCAGLIYFRTPVKFTLHPAGIRRRCEHGRLMRAKGTDLFLEWNEIDEISAEEFVSNFGIEIRYPIIRVRSKVPLPAVGKISSDSDFEIVMRAGDLLAEPNALINLIRFLKDNPEHRSILADPDARELLRPLPLFERFRQAKEVKRLESEAKKAKKVARKNSG